MKKVVFSMLIFIMIGSMGTPILAAAEVPQQIYEQNMELEKNKSMEAFLDMQDQITSTLKVKNEHYVYDKDEVKDIIYKFNFDDLKKNTDLNYTKETFYNEAINSIENTVLKPTFTTRNANKYNRNHYESGWNYIRSWLDTNKAKNSIKNLYDAADVLAAGGGVGGIVGIIASGPLAPISGFLSAIGGLTALYFTNMARNTEYKNNGTGVVLEINKFTGIYSVWSQDEYKG